MDGREEESDVDTSTTPGCIHTPGKTGTDTSEVALVAEGGSKDALGDHAAAVGAHQLALRIVRIFH